MTPPPPCPHECGGHGATVRATPYSNLETLVPGIFSSDARSSKFQAGLELIDPPFSTIPVLRWQACATIPGLFKGIAVWP